MVRFRCDFHPFLVFLLITLISPANAWHHNIHKRMSLDHLRQVFSVDNVLDVPEYSVAPFEIHNHHFNRIKRQVKSTADGKLQLDRKLPTELEKSLDLILDAFDKKYHLKLTKANHLFDRQPKVFYADMVNGVPVLKDATPELSVSSLQEALYQDINHMAAFSVRTSKDQNDLLIDGVLGDDYVIKPIPTDLKVVIAVDTADGAFIGQDADDNSNVVPTSAPSTGTTEQQSTENLNSSSIHYHIVYKRATAEKNLKLTEMSEDGFMMSESEPVANVIQAPTSGDYGLLDDALFIELSTDGKRAKRAPFPVQSVWPEVLVLVDYATFNLHGGNEKRITSYFATFWNAVDLRYRILPQPDIRLQLSGIIISRNPGFMPYIEDNRMSSPDDDSFDSKQALSDMAKHLFTQQDMLPKFDLAMVITKLDMCRKKDDDGPCVRGTAGFAYVGGACHVDESRQKLNKAGIVEDSGGFSGVIVAAHEVGHLLGCVHDGTAAPSYLGGPGAEACSWYDGYIMSDLRHNVNGFKWSPCSVQQFDHFLSRPQAACLFDPPLPGIRLGTTLPGKIIPLDWQCRLDRGTTACFKDERVCTQLYCHDKDTGYCIAFRPAAEGSPCGSGRSCRDGVCLTEGAAESASQIRTAASVFPDEPNTPFPVEDTVPEELLPPGPQPLCQGDIPGVRVSGMPCKEFLRATGTTYCDHRDILRYCCNSRRIFCPPR